MPLMSQAESWFCSAAIQLGVVGQEWQLLDDFFQQDDAAVVIRGFLSTILNGSAGILQGRRFSVDAFMSSMHVLKQGTDAVAATSRTILSDFASWTRFSTKQLPGIECRFNQLDDTPESLINQLLSIGHKASWRNVRLWWLIRITGKWPVPAIATGNCVAILPFCSRCGLDEIPWNHVLGARCCDTAEAYELQNILNTRQTADELFDSICFVSHTLIQQLRAAYWEDRRSASLHEGRLETWETWPLSGLVSRKNEDAL